MITVKLDHTMNVLDVDRYAAIHNLKIVKFFPGRGKKQHTLLAIGDMPPPPSKRQHKRNAKIKKEQKRASARN